MFRCLKINNEETNIMFNEAALAKVVKIDDKGLTTVKETKWLSKIIQINEIEC